MGISVFPPASGGGTNRYTQIFTSSGTFVAPATCNSVSLFMVGGGGAGGSAYSSGANINCSGGGGGGAVIRRDVNVVPGASYTVTIGAGGSPVPSTSGTGNAGGNTMFGALVTALGGGGGANTGNGVLNSGGNGACGGGAGTASGSPYTQKSGWGGSAGQPVGLMVTGSNSGSTSYYPNASSRGGRGTVHSKGQDGFVGSNWSDGYFAMTQGIGIEGFGDGGAGVTFNGSTQMQWLYPSGGSSVNAGGSGAANTGAGGAGGTGNGGSSTTGGSGGSGYCVVVYWA